MSHEIQGGWGWRSGESTSSPEYFSQIQSCRAATILPCQQMVKCDVNHPHVKNNKAHASATTAILMRCDSVMMNCDVVPVLPG